MSVTGLFVFGCGGHARSIADVGLDAGIPKLLFAHETAKPGESLFGFPVQATLPQILAEGWATFPGSGDNDTRRQQLEWLVTKAFPITSLISRRAYVGRGTVVQPGTFVAHHAHLGPLVSVGRGSIINTAAIVDHESQIGDFTHISVNSTVAGRCRIGDLVFIGAGATVIDHISIASRVVIGAGATVVDDISEPGVYVGSPARLLPRQHASAHE